MSDSEKTIWVRIAANATELKNGMNEAVHSVEQGTSQITGIFEKIRAPLIALTSILAGGAIFKEAVDATKEWTSENVKLARQLGISTEQASVLSVALDDIHSSTEVYSHAAQMMTRQIAAGSDAFEKLGVKTRDQKGELRSTADVMSDVLGRLNNLKEGTDRNAAGVKIFGRSWGEAQILLNLSGKVMDEAREKAERLNLIVGADSVEANKQYKAAMNDVGDVLKAIQVGIGRQLMPVLTSLGNWFGTEGPSLIEPTVTVMKSLLSVVFGVVAAFQLAGSAIGGFFATISELSPIEAARMGLQALSGDVIGLQASIAGAQAKNPKFAASLKETFADLTKQAAAFGDLINGIWEKQKPAKASGRTMVGKQGTEGADLSKGDAKDTAKKDQEEVTALLKASLEQQLELVHHDFAARRDLQQQWLDYNRQVYGENSKEYLNALRDLERADRELAENKAKLEDDKMKAANKWLEENAKINRKILDDLQKQWDSVFSNIGRVVGSAFEGVIRGTTTVQQAFMKMGENILASMINNIAAGLEQYIVAELIKREVGATTAKKSVLQQAWEAAAGAFSATVQIPYIGPVLAPIAAAGAFTAVAAFGSNISSAAGGWDQVPRDQLAMVHKNEMVLPADLAGRVRAMANAGDAGSAGGRAGDVHVHVSAMDSLSFEGWLDRQDAVMVRKLRSLATNGQLSPAR